MKILISTFGTRGDIQPFVALGRGLKAAGHTVAVCTPDSFKSMVEEHGLLYAYMNSEFFDVIQTQVGRAAFEDFGKALSLARQVMPSFRRIIQDEWKAAQAFHPDAMVFHPKTLGSFHIAEKLRVPMFMALPLPFYTPTQAFPNPLFSRVRLGGRFNRFTYRLMTLPSGMYAGLTNRFRVDTLGLPPRRRFADPLMRSDGGRVPILYPYSTHVLPVPHDFPPHAHVTGYWFLDGSDNWQPPAELVQFIEDGPPPVYIGFGSMSGNKAQQRAGIVIEALARTGQRGTLARGWGGLAAVDVPDNIMVVDEVPHDWLFQRVAAVVHHGGAGTTAAGLRAGKPTVVCPFIADQPFWGTIVHQRGVGPQPIPQRKLTVPRLADAITLATQDATMHQRARELGEKIRTEDGVATAIRIIETTLRTTSQDRYVPAVA
jgi:sterol 3beta-glucosyltransferase